MQEDTLRSALPQEESSSNQAISAPRSEDTPRISGGVFSRLFSSIRSKIILPYLFLTVAVAMLGTFIVTRLIAGTLEERFTNQLLEASRVAGDGIVRREEDNLETLRLMVFTVGVNDAIAEGDIATLREVLEPLAANADLDGVLVVNSKGQQLLGLHAVRTPEGPGQYEITQGADLTQWPLVAPVLAGHVDQYGDKYAGLVNSPAGVFMYTSGPVITEDGEVVGAILVGVSLDRVLRQLKAESLADITFYSDSGQAIASTFPDWQTPTEQAALEITPDFFRDILDAPEDQTPFSEQRLFERSFRAAFVPMQIRRDTLGALGVSLPSNFIVQAASTSRTTFALLFSLTALFTVLLGLLVAQRIVRPVMRLLQVSRAITSGDLSQRVGITPGDELGVLASSFDTMTDHLQHSTRLLQQEVARVQAIVRSIADGVIVRDNRGEVIMMNNAAQSLLSRNSNFRDSPLAEIEVVPDQHVDGHNSLTPPPHRVELGDHVVSAQIAPVLTKDGDTVGNVLVMRDVTREAAAERLKDDFVNSISHELRTPLTVIKGYSDLLRMEPDRMRAEAYERAMSAIFANAESLERMITKLIDLSEMAAGTLYLDHSRVSLNTFVEQVLRQWDERLKQCDLYPIAHLDGTDLVIDADVRRLRWALDALLENACQYCLDGGDLNVTVSQVGSAAVLQIKDPGVGIAAEDVPHVFQRFYRGRSTDMNGNLLDPRGMGQGLYVVKSVVEGHDGRVWVESEPGNGSEFSVLLPLAEGVS